MDFGNSRRQAVPVWLKLIIVALCAGIAVLAVLFAMRFSAIHTDAAEATTTQVEVLQAK